jgi:hypothetical protein
VKNNTGVDRVAEAAARLERIKLLVEQLAPTPVNSRQYRTLTAALRFEAHAYRKSLDTEQARATHDGRRKTPPPPGSLKGASAALTVLSRRTHSHGRGRSAPAR